MKKSYSEIIGAINRLGFYLKDGETTKVHKKFSKIIKLMKPYVDEYNDKLEDIRLDLASVDSNGNIILDEKGGYTYTKDNLKQLSLKVKELSNELTDVNVIPVINPQGLEEYTFLKDYLSGVNFIEEVIEEEEEL